MHEIERLLRQNAAKPSRELDVGAVRRRAEGRGRARRRRLSVGTSLVVAGLSLTAISLLPADDSSFGFDNVAGSLGVSPALLERYISAAGKISRLAIGTETAPTLAVFDAPHDTSQNNHIEGLPFGTRGGMRIEHEFPADGDYVFTVKGMTGYFTAVLGNVEGEKLERVAEQCGCSLATAKRRIGAAHARIQSELSDG